MVFLTCLAYISFALPDSVLGITWPAMRHGFHQPLAALGLLMPFGVVASVLSSAMNGRILARINVGQLLAISTVLSALALVGFATAPAFVFLFGATLLLGLGGGAIDSGLNAFAASNFNARRITWMHAAYGVGATIGPVSTAAALTAGFGWQWIYVLLAGMQGMLALIFLRTRRRWRTSEKPRIHGDGRTTRRTVLLSALIFAVQTGVDSGPGIWGYVFLTSGQGYSKTVAGGVVSAYWATMCVGRLILGPVAERVGTKKVLRGATVAIIFGAALMIPAGTAIVGMIVLGLAVAPMFPLLTLTTADRVKGNPDKVIGIQVAASTVGGASLSAGIGIIMQEFGAKTLAPALLTLAVLTTVIYYGLTNSER